MPEENAATATALFKQQWVKGTLAINTSATSEEPFQGATSETRL